MIMKFDTPVRYITLSSGIPCMPVGHQMDAENTGAQCYKMIHF